MKSPVDVPVLVITVGSLLSPPPLVDAGKPGKPGPPPPSSGEIMISSSSISTFELLLILTLFDFLTGPINGLTLPPTPLPQLSLISALVPPL